MNEEQQTYLNMCGQEQQVFKHPNWKTNLMGESDWRMDLCRVEG